MQNDTSNVVLEALVPESCTISTPPRTPSAITPLVIDGSSKKPTNFGITVAPLAEDDVFASAAHVVSVPCSGTVAPQNPIAQRTANHLPSPAGYNGFTPRSDRVSQLPSAANAQGLYPPDALLFVANLSGQRTEDELDASCHRAFDAFGPCHLKNVEDANRAINEGVNFIIDGRKIRIERAKAERAVVLSKPGGGPISEAEARHLLEHYGPIELCVPTTRREEYRFHMREGMYVKFAFYLDCKDALSGFDNNGSEYQLLMAPHVEPRMRPGPDGGTVFCGFSPPRSPIDQKSIFVGNLPEGTTKEEVHAEFSEFGNIVQLNIVKKTFGDNATNTFAFIEYSTPQEAHHATRAEKTLRGSKLRIEPKEHSTRHAQGVGNALATPQNRVLHPLSVFSPSYNPERRPRFQRHSFGNMYAAHPMATPTPYNSIPIATYTAFPPLPGNRMLPLGMYSPTPTQPMHYQAGAHYTPPAYGGHFIQSIQETREESL